MNGNLRGKRMALIWLSCVLSSCVSAASDDASIDPACELLIAEASQIVRVHEAAGHNKLTTRISSSNGSNIVDLDYHLSGHQIFWIEASWVLSADLSSSSRENSSRAIIKRAPNVWQPLGLAVDFFGQRLYVADALGRKVDAFSLKGKNHVIVAAEGFERPSAIVLDPEAALAFVADSDKILRMNLDGTSLYPIIRKSVPSSISSLAIDRASKTLFWWDSEVQAIESSRFGGEGRRVVHHRGSASPAITGLAYLAQRLYFADGAGAIWRVRADAERSQQADKVLDGMTDVRRLRAMDPNAQAMSSSEGRRGEPPCQQDNGGCQHACLAGASGSKSCACYVEHVLGEDARSCKLPKQLLLYSHKQLIRGRGLQIGAKIALSFASPMTLSLSIDSEFEGRILYFADAYNNTIYKADLKSGKVEAMVRYEGSASISVDRASRNLYYSDLAEGTLNVVSLDNYSYRKRLLDSLSEPKDVIVHPSRGQLYFYDEAKIKRVNNDGTKFTTIHTPIRHRSLKLALDLAGQRLYWCLNDLERASKNASIQHATLDGGDVVSLQATSPLYDVSAMLVHEQWIYVVAMGYEKLMRLSKTDGKQLAEVAPTERQPFYALAVMRQADPIQHNPCASAPTACDKLCFVVPRTKSRPGLARQCACPQGERLVGKVGKRICVPDHMVKELTLVHRCEPGWEFTCRNGRCIPKTQLCDGVNDCLDRSDERGCTDTEPNYFIAGR